MYTVYMKKHLHQIRGRMLSEASAQISIEQLMITLIGIDWVSYLVKT